MKQHRILAFLVLFSLGGCGSEDASAPPGSDGGPGDGATLEAGTTADAPMTGATDAPPTTAGPDGGAGASGDDAATPGDDGPPYVPPTKVHVDSAHAATAVVGKTGGTLTATGADGVVYQVTVPAGALRDPTELRVEPFTAIDGLPFTGGLAAGFHLSPAGIVFAKAVVVTVTLPAGAATGDLSGFCYDGDDEDLHLCPFELAGSVLTFKVAHFSGGGAGHGPGMPMPAGAQAQALQQLALYQRQTPMPVAADIAAILVRWWMNSVLPGLRAASLDLDPRPRFAEWQAWQQAAREGPWPQAVLDAIAVELAAELESAPREAADAIRRIINQSNRACETSRSLSQARNVMRWQARAALFVLDTPVYQLDLDTVLANVCVKVSFASTDFPQVVMAGQSGTLMLKVGYKIADAPAQFDQPIRVTVVPSGTEDTTTVAGNTNAEGVYTATFTRAAGDDPLRLRIHACFADRLLQLICQDGLVERGVRTDALDKYLSEIFEDPNAITHNSNGTDVPNPQQWRLQKRDSLGRPTYFARRNRIPGNGFEYFDGETEIVQVGADGFKTTTMVNEGQTRMFDAKFVVRPDGTYLVGTCVEVLIHDEPPTTLTTMVNAKCKVCM